MKKSIYWALLLAAVFFAGCEKKESEDVFATQKTTEQKLFRLQDLDGKNYEIEKTQKGLDFKNIEKRIVFLDFWATWCPPCRAEIPHLVKLQSKYANDFMILGVLLEDKSREDIAEFARDYGINYAVTLGGDNSRLAKTLGAKGMPFMVMYDKEGNYFTHYVGAVPQEMIERDIKRILEGKK